MNYLSNNQLSGALPFSLSNFSSIQILLLGGNNFSGPIPPSVGELHQAVKIDLSGNSLTGEIPHEIGECLHLNYLDLSKNNLAGPIPPEISNIRILNYLNVSRNHLTEAIPLSIGSMKSLTTADFSFNDLSGRLPETGQFSVFNATSYAGNPKLCGSTVNNPCNATGCEIAQRVQAGVRSGAIGVLAGVRDGGHRQGQVIQAGQRVGFVEDDGAALRRRFWFWVNYFVHNNLNKNNLFI